VHAVADALVRHAAVHAAPDDPAFAKTFDQMRAAVVEREIRDAAARELGCESVCAPGIEDRGAAGAMEKNRGVLRCRGRLEQESDNSTPSVASNFMNRQGGSR